MYPPNQINAPSRAAISCAGLVLALVTSVIPAFAAGTFYVDATHPNSALTGPGTAEAPYSTISAACAAQGGAGTTIIVKPGLYREQVSVGASGAAGNPFVIRASEPGVVIDGADSFSGTTRWTPFQGTVHLASTVTWPPRQVYVDGVRLVAATGAPESIPPQSFVYVAGAGLYVNLGGDNPGAHQTLVGRRSAGFRVTTRTFVRIEGFQIYRAEDKGIYVLGGSSDVSIIGNQVSASFTQGITITASTNCTVGSNVVFENGDHGILMSAGVTGTRVESNESFRNARVATRAANGIQLFGCSGNTIIANRWHHNQDTGAQFNGGSNNNVSIYNASWSNGDHGFDHLTSSGVAHYGDVAWGNFKDGFSFEGDSPGGRMFNCISTDNGLTTNEYDLWVDANSSVGFASNSNVLWNSTAQPPVKYITLPAYSTVSAFSAATGLDTRSRQANPLFANTAIGDFHVGAGSPAIDMADATVPGWPSADAAGLPRLDDLTITNRGIGVPPYGDIGIFESIPGEAPPVVTAPASRTANEGTTITVNVTASDPNGDPITMLTADLSSLPAGHNAVFVVNETHTAGTLTWTTTRNDGRVNPYPVVFRASNNFIGQATTSIVVVDIPDRAPVVTAPANVQTTKNSAVIVNVTASDPDGDAIISLTADLSNLGGNAAFTASADKRSGTLTWTPTNRTNADVTFTARNALTGIAITRIHVKNLLSSEPSHDPAASEESDVEATARPSVLALSSAIPNPSRGDNVAFVLDLPHDSDIRWNVFDLQGREVFAEHRFASAGRVTLHFATPQPRPVPGVYFGRVRVGDATLVRRFLVQ